MTAEKMIETIVDFFVSMGGKLLAAAVVMITGHFVIRYVIRLTGRLKGTDKIDKTVKSFLDNFIKFGLYCLLVISVISILGVPMASIVTVLASAGVAIGLALQGALGNFAGGIMIILFKPFSIGDYIDAGGASGTVSNISLFYTTLITLDNKKITIPNSTITGSNVVNYFSEGNRRVDITFTVAYGSDIDKVQRVILAAITAHPLVLGEPAPFVRLSKTLDSALEFSSRVWCRCEDYWTVFYDVTELITKTLTGEGIEIPFPQMDIHMR